MKFGSNYIKCIIENSFCPLDLCFLKLLNQHCLGHHYSLEGETSRLRAYYTNYLTTLAALVLRIN